MSLSNKAVATIFGLGILFSPVSLVSAETRGFSIAPGSITAQGTATADDNVNLPNTATPTMIVSFILPPDYQADTTAQVQLYIQQSSGVCGAVLSVISATRRRNGFESSSAGGGVLPAGNNPVVSFPGANIVKVKTFNVKTPGGGAINGTKPGDSVTIRIDRLVDNAADTCASTVFVTGVLVQYQSTP
jgi:hypothetical protein